MRTVLLFGVDMLASMLPAFLFFMLVIDCAREAGWVW